LPLATTVSGKPESEAVQVAPFAGENALDVPTTAPLYFADKVIEPVADLIITLPEYVVPESVTVLGVMLPILGARVMVEPEGIFTAENPNVNAVPLVTAGIALNVIFGAVAAVTFTVKLFEIFVLFVPTQFTV
jgi:hypothetical protein